MTATDAELLAAASLLGCRLDASPAEVRTACRRALLRARPDLGLASADWVTVTLAARERLLSTAPADRRRPARSATVSAGRALRRSTWAPGSSAGWTVDLRL